MSHTLELFKKDTCPYCKRVMAEIDAQGREDIIYLDITKDKSNLDRLIEVGGKNQVPCLFIDGTPMYESLDIIDWLKDN